MDPSSSWDSLRKQARKLEAQLDEQMQLYRKLVNTKVDNATDNDLEIGIDQLLKQLQQVNSQMQTWVSSGGSEIFSHTLTRHQEILQDLTQEFNRLRSSHRAKKEHASLLDDFREFDRTRLDLEDDGGSYDQAVLNERASLHRSTGQMDGVISQAQETIKALVYQRSTFGGINSKLSNVSSRLPTGILGLSLFIRACVPEIAAENSEGLRRLRKFGRQSRSKFNERYTLIQSLFALFFHSISSSSVLQFPLSWPTVMVRSPNVLDRRLGQHFKGMNLRNDGRGSPRAFLRRMEEDPVWNAMNHKLSADDDAGFPSICYQCCGL
nr:golgi snap receptor complex member 1-1 [Ipomoea batatas]